MSKGKELLKNIFTYFTEKGFGLVKFVLVSRSGTWTGEEIRSVELTEGWEYVCTEYYKNDNLCVASFKHFSTLEQILAEGERAMNVLMIKMGTLLLEETSV